MESDQSQESHGDVALPINEICPLWPGSPTSPRAHFSWLAASVSSQGMQHVHPKSGETGMQNATIQWANSTHHE